MPGISTEMLAMLLQFMPVFPDEKNGYSLWLSGLNV
jgi:hypothetical protein